MSDEILKRDQNTITVLGGVTNDSDQDIVMLRVDPISKRLLINATISGGYVSSVNGITGAVTLVAGTNITSIVPLGQNITINAANQSPSIGGTITGGTANSILYVNPDGVIAQDNANFSYTDGTTQVFQLGSVSTGGQAITKIKGGVLSGSSTTDNFVNITGTFPTVLTAQSYLINIQLTGAGSSAFNTRGFNLDYLTGYTGPNSSIAVRGSNQSRGTGTGGLTGGAANYGGAFVSSGLATSGHNVGLQLVAQGSSILNAGMINRATSNSGTPALNIGEASFALNATVNVGIGGFLMSTAPTLTESAAIIGDNGATGSYIFRGQTAGVLGSYFDSTGNLGFGINSDKTISVDRNTVSNTAGKSLTMSSGSATSGATDKGSTLALATGITTGGSVGNINFNTAGIQTTGTGGILQAQMDNPYQVSPYNIYGYTAGDVLTMSGTGSGTATIVIDTVSFTGVPLTWHIGTAGTSYSYGDYDYPTGGTGFNAAFIVIRISGTSDNTVSTVGYTDYLGIHSNAGLYSTGNNYFGYNITGDAKTSSNQYINGAINQYDENGIGFVNILGSKTVIGSKEDYFGYLIDSSAVIESDNAYGLILRNSTSTTKPLLASFNENDAQTFQLFPKGSAEFQGNVNTSYGGFGRIQNLLLQSETFTNASWTKTQVTATDNFITAPNGTLTGGKIVANVTGSAKRLRQITASLPAGTYTVSCWLRGVNKGDSLSFTFAGTGSSFNLLPMGDWTRYSYTVTTSSTGTITFDLQPISGQTFYIWGAQIQENDGPGIYYKTTSTTLDTSALAMYSNNNIRTQQSLINESYSGGTISGETWNDSTQKARAVYQSGIKQMLVGCIFTQTADKTVANTVTETSIVGTGVGSVTLPANFFIVGKTIRVRIRGILSDTSTPTLNIKAKLGSTALVSTGALSMPSGLTNKYFVTEVTMTCRTIGASGTVMASGEFSFDANATPPVSETFGMSATSATTIDTTVSQVIDFTATWGTANASNTITSQVGLVEIIN